MMRFSILSYGLIEDDGFLHLKILQIISALISFSKRANKPLHCFSPTIIDAHYLKLRRFLHELKQFKHHWNKFSAKAPLIFMFNLILKLPKKYHHDISNSSIKVETKQTD